MVRIIFGRVNIRSAPIRATAWFPYSAIRRAPQEHQRAFNSLLSELKRSCELHEEHGAGAAELQKLHSLEGYSLHDASLFRTSAGNMFAIDRGGRWLAMSAPHDAHPSNVAEEVQELLRQVGADAIPTDLSIDVDLICSRSRLTEGIEALGSVVRLTITVKLPNQFDTYREARRRMRELGARSRRETYENPDGLTDRRIPKLAEGVETGDIDLTAESSTGKLWSLSDSPEEFNASRQDGISLAALLLLAIAWLISEWPWSGGRGAS